MKAVFARILRQFAPIGHALLVTLGKRQTAATKGVIAEQLRAEAIEIA